MLQTGARSSLARALGRARRHAIVARVSPSPILVHLALATLHSTLSYVVTTATLLERLGISVGTLTRAVCLSPSVGTYRGRVTLVWPGRAGAVDLSLRVHDGHAQLLRDHTRRDVPAIRASGDLGLPTIAP